MRNLLAALAAFFLGLLAGSAVLAGPPVVSPTDLQLDGPGLNVDDPCFWRDPLDPAASLLFVTTKSSGAVEVYRAATGALIGTIPGFVRPNNCAVTGDLLLTTDRDAGNVKAHHLPDLTLVHTFGADAIKPMGVDVLHTPAGQALAYVTDSGDASVHVYDVPTGTLVRHFPTGFGLGIEAVVADDLYQRVLVSREDKGGHGIGLFAPDGTLVREFGGVAFAHDTEGLAIYRCGDHGYLVASDQGSSTTEFEVFDRTTLTHLATFTLDDGAGDVTNATDGVDVFQTPLPGFPGGVFAACDGCGDTVPDEMDVVGWERIAAAVHLDVCPDGAEPDCRTTPCRERVLPLADTGITAAAATTPAGTAPTLEVGTTPAAEALLRFAVPDLTGFDLQAVALRLTAESGPGAAGPAGGLLFATSAAWSEADTTYETRPAPLGAPLATGGAVTLGGIVDFDLTGVVHGGGTYDFTLVGGSADAIRYRSREAGQSPPALLLTLHASSPPEVVITSPADGATVATGAPCTLAGTASDPEDVDLSATLVWTSDVDGPLGTGGALQPTLTAGLHTITAGVTDRAGLHTTAAVHLRAAVPTTTSTSSTSSSSTSTSSSTSSSSSSTTVVTPTTASSSSSTATTMPGATSTSSPSTSIAPSTTASTSTTTSSSTSTSSTATTSSTTRSVVPTTSTTSTLPPPVCTPACDDGDRCTADTCIAARGCVSVEQSATAPPGVLCTLDNLRDLRRNGPPSLGRRLDAIERQVDAATRERAPGRCQRSLRGATRATHALAAALERFAARVPGGEPAARLAREALRLQTRTATLARSFCRDARPAGTAAQP